ncbi:MAG TPA: DUF4392 domain-containing protein [Gemmatales bacterium]|nr:DUF4392 domain-containing protein [Gemmatales bacterium]HMP58952.1 DUF4392 domain-containing protein [Gemmatales bacterium]
MSERALTALESAIQVDPGGRGLGRLPGPNLFSACAGDLARACTRLASLPSASRVGLFTGFFVVSAGAAETDGPFGTVLLAEVLARLGHRPAIFSDRHTLPGIALARADLPRDLQSAIEVVNLADGSPWSAGWDDFQILVAIERPGPGADGHLRSMNGTVITDHHGPAHLWFERSPVPTIGVGDGGNEIGMGKLPVELIAAHVPYGAEIACRLATTDLIVAGVSNWGGYALAAGTALLLGRRDLCACFDPDREWHRWAEVLPRSGLVDALTHRAEMRVDGLEWATYIRPLAEIYALLTRG